MPKKVHRVKAMVFPAVMFRCESWTTKKGEHQGTNAFELWCLQEKTLESPLDCKEIKQSILKEIHLEYSLEGLMLLNCGVFKEKTLESPLDCKEIKQSILKEIHLEYSLEGLMLKLKLQYFGHLKRRTDSLEKNLILGKTEGGRRRGWQRMRWLDGITNSMDVILSQLY